MVNFKEYSSKFEEILKFKKLEIIQVAQFRILVRRSLNVIAIVADLFSISCTRHKNNVHCTMILNVGHGIPGCYVSRQLCYNDLFMVIRAIIWFL